MVSSWPDSAAGCGMQYTSDARGVKTSGRPNSRPRNASPERGTLVLFGRKRRSACRHMPVRSVPRKAPSRFEAKVGALGSFDTVPPPLVIACNCSAMVFEVKGAALSNHKIGLLGASHRKRATYLPRLVP